MEWTDLYDPASKVRQSRITPSFSPANPFKQKHPFRQTTPFGYDIYWNGGFGWMKVREGE